MFCNKCGKVLGNTAFCPSCGAEADYGPQLRSVQATGKIKLGADHIIKLLAVAVVVIVIAIIAITQINASVQRYDINNTLIGFSEAVESLDIYEINYYAAPGYTLNIPYSDEISSAVGFINSFFGIDLKFRIDVNNIKLDKKRAVVTGTAHMSINDSTNLQGSSSCVINMKKVDGEWLITTFR